MNGQFKTLFIREIQGAIIDFRFWVVLLLCVSIIPLSFYVSTRSYSQRLSDYQQEVQTYKDRTSVGAHMVAEGVHPPSPLSIFSLGLGNKMPYKVFTARNGDFRIAYAKPDNKQDLLGEIDYAFIIAFVLSILAIVFTFNAISGDKENGVLRQILANPVLRKQILMAKLIGNYVVFLVPYIISLLIAVLFVYVSGVIPIFSGELLLSVLIMLGISLVFILTMFNLGLWISALTQSSTLSINILLLIWIILGLVIPKASPIIGAAIYPVESTGVFESKRTLLRNDIEKEQIKEESDLYESLRAIHHPESQGVGSGRGLDNPWANLNSAFDEQVVPLREKYEKRLNSETEMIANDYLMRCNKQNTISRSISVLSPITLINNLLTEFSGTGNSEVDNFNKQAKQYQATVKQAVYDQFEYKIYRSGGSTSSSAYRSGDSQDDIPIPVLDNYQFVDTARIFQQNWVDIALLGFYCLLFFVSAFVSFLRFDVR
jgi:ABC-type transport system involved in multi-copper enzyme maturation permease subunit